jgi:Zn-dependent M28 family amino/carboxypeptidase
LRAAIEAIVERSVMRDLEAVAVPRHHRRAPAGLAHVARFLDGELGAAGFTVMHQPLRHDGARADNLVAERAGRDASRVVMVVAHYDAVEGTRGADDNASGVAGLLAAARVLGKVPTEATVRVVAFAFEEQGMVGSQAYLSSLDDAERAKITGVFNLEMIGYLDGAPGSQRYPAGVAALVGDRRLPTTGDFIGAIASPSDAPPIAALEAARSFVPGLRAEIIAVPRPLVLLAPDLLRSDHGPFWLAGVPAVMIGDTADFRTPHYHRPSDRPETLDRPFLVRTCRWVAAAAGLLAGPLAPAPATTAPR